MATDNLKILNQFFDKIYVLTIERAVDRQQKIKEILSEVEFEFFYGFDKQNLSIDDLVKDNIYNVQKAIEVNRYNKPMKLGEVACSMGHKGIYEDALCKNYNNILVLEDDVFIDENGLKFLDKIVVELPKDWDVIYFDYFKNEATSFNKKCKQFIYQLKRIVGSLKYSKLTIKNLFATPYSMHLKKAGYHDFASAYGLSKNAMKKIVAAQSPIIYPADHVLPILITNEILIGFISRPKVFSQYSQTNKTIYGSMVEN